MHCIARRGAYPGVGKKRTRRPVASSGHGRWRSCGAELPVVDGRVQGGWANASGSSIATEVSIAACAYSGVSSVAQPIRGTYPAITADVVADAKDLVRRHGRHAAQRAAHTRRVMTTRRLRMMLVVVMVFRPVGAGCSWRVLAAGSCRRPGLDGRRDRK